MKCQRDKRKQLPSPHALAVEFYSPFYLLLSMSDGVERKETKEEIAKSYECYIDDFLQRHFRKTERRKEIIVEHFVLIKKYGFSEVFLSQILQENHLEPARVLSQEKGFYRIITDKGEKLAEVSGKFRFQAAVFFRLSGCW